MAIYNVWIGPLQHNRVRVGSDFYIFEYLFFKYVCTRHRSRPPLICFLNFSDSRRRLRIRLTRLSCRRRQLAIADIFLLFLFEVHVLMLRLRCTMVTSYPENTLRMELKSQPYEVIICLPSSCPAVTISVTVSATRNV